MAPISPPHEAPPHQAASLGSLRARIQENPQDGESWLGIALLLARSSPTPELRHAISRCIELLPDNYQAWLLAGLELQQRQGPAGAQQWLRHVAGQRPELAAPRLALAQLQVAAGDQAAEAEFQSVIRQFPGDARACLLYAEYLQNHGHPGKAGDYLERALGLQPEVTENWTALARIRLAEQRHDNAVAAATRALELDVNAREARMTRAEAYRQAAQWQLAESDYQHLLQSMPQNPYILLGLGACRAGQRDFAQALQSLRQALEFKPDFVEARLNLALVHACTGNHEQATPELERLLASGTLDTTQRDQAQVCLASLQEHRRLQPLLPETARSHDLSNLQAALEQRPELLWQTNPHMAERLQQLAEACRRQEWPLAGDAGLTVNGPLDAFVEACLLSRHAHHAADIAAAWTLSQQALAPGAVFTVDQQPLAGTWQAVTDRRDGTPPLFGKGGVGEGEAWLRYWHYRLFSSAPAEFPGQFKFAPNSIGLHRTTAPQHLASTIRLLTEEIHPSLPLGPGRACFMLVAIAWIHPFVDGNGRLSRFAFAAELEAAGIAPILLLTQPRKALTDCQDRAQYRNDFAPFAEFLQRARASTIELSRAVAEALQAG